MNKIIQLIKNNILGEHITMNNNRITQIQPQNNLIQGLFNELYEYAFQLQTIQGLEENTFAALLMNHFHEIPRFSHLNDNVNIWLLDGAIMNYGHLLYEFMYFNQYNEEETLDTINNIISYIDNHF